MAEARRHQTISIELEAEKLDLIRRAAGSEGHSVPVYVAEAAVEKAQLDELDRRTFELDDETFEEVERVLAETSGVDPKLVELFRKQVDWID